MPAALVAVRLDCQVPGVVKAPLITPVEGFRLKPGGKLDAEYDVGTPVLEIA
jgi:hypothetical protein